MSATVVRRQENVAQSLNSRRYPHLFLSSCLSRHVSQYLLKFSAILMHAALKQPFLLYPRRFVFTSGAFSLLPVKDRTFCTLWVGFFFLGGGGGGGGASCTKKCASLLVCAERVQWCDL